MKCNVKQIILAWIEILKQSAIILAVIHRRNNKMIHVVLCVYDPSGSYSQHAGVVMSSMFENTQSEITVHVLHDDTLTEENRKNFIRTAEKYGQHVDLVDVTEHEKKISGELVKVSGEWTVGTLYRMFIPDVLPYVEKVIYLDCDILVNLDIQELWDINIDGMSMAGVIDYARYTTPPFSVRAVHFKIIGCDVEKYINAGVVVMNLQKVRERGNLCSMFIEWLLRYSYLPLFPDQDALNSIFFGDIKIIDDKFNMYDLNKNLSGCIVHMWNGKPWQFFTGAEHEKMYWKYYLRSAWGEGMTRDDVIEFFGKFIAPEIAELQEKTHKHTNQCMKRIIMNIPKKIREAFHTEFFDVCGLILKDKFYRLKYNFSRS